MAGAHDMWQAYKNLKSNKQKAFKLYITRADIHCLFSHFSNAREWLQAEMGHGAEDCADDQKANQWGRERRDSNHFRPVGLPEKY
ncbi:serum amyloid A [Siniperca chuatsi]|uniref:serum amyloid A n=1 Tax=Siniperca chuatsi TaxID=119488 RepID=UPI001CE0C9D1|nr:serum amyloid A [Siniperca chuatsi]